MRAAAAPLYQSIHALVHDALRPRGMRLTSVVRLALLASGLLSARSCSLARVAWALCSLGAQAQASSVERRLRRTLRDGRLRWDAAWPPLLAAVVDWDRLAAADGMAVLALDETTRSGEANMLRISLAWRGDAVPLACVCWDRRERLGPGEYWRHMDAALAQAAAAIPPGIRVAVLADRAYDVPALWDRIVARGWHPVIRLKARGKGRWTPEGGEEGALREAVEAGAPGPGALWGAQGSIFKKGGWRRATVSAAWRSGCAERLAVISDLPPGEGPIALYARRFWIEPSFRHDKSAGLGLEDSQARGTEGDAALQLALALVHLVALAAGSAMAADHIARQRAKRPGPPARHARARMGIFSMGLAALLTWDGPRMAGPWRLDACGDRTWDAECRAEGIRM